MDLPAQTVKYDLFLQKWPTFVCDINFFFLYMKIVVIKGVLTKLTSHTHYMRTSLIFVLRQLKKDDTMLTKGVQVTGGVNTILQDIAIKSLILVITD